LDKILIRVTALEKSNSELKTTLTTVKKSNEELETTLATVKKSNEELETTMQTTMEAVLGVSIHASLLISLFLTSLLDS
jgi:hypothetical protein